MRFLVIGCGSMGERHIQNLLALSAGEVLACDTSTERLAGIEGKYKVKTYHDLAQALNQPVDAFIICVPTSLHLSFALKGVAHNSHLFIEKPVSHDLAGVDELIALARNKDRQILVGCNMRFHPALKILRQVIADKTLGQIYSIRAQFGHYLPNWRPGQDYRQSYSAQKELGGGIVLDSIHEIDYVMWLLGNVKEVVAFSGRISDLEIETEDYTEILLKNDEGVCASIHLDYLRQDKYRACEVVGSEGTFVWQSWGKLPERIMVKVYTKSDKKWQSFFEGDFEDINLPYLDEMRHFINCIEGKDTPLVDGSTAKRDLEVALAAKESAESHKAVPLR